LISAVPRVISPRWNGPTSPRRLIGRRAVSIAYSSLVYV
jgi:hypothetical protein